MDPFRTSDSPQPSLLSSPIEPTRHVQVHTMQSDHAVLDRDLLRFAPTDLMHRLHCMLWLFFPFQV